MVVGAVLVVLITGAGAGLTLWADVRLLLEERLALGAVVGAVAVSAVSFVAFTALGMGWPTLVLGLGVPGAVAAVGARRHPGVLRGELVQARRRLALPARRRASLRPFLALAAVTTAVSTRTLSLAYQRTDLGVSVGNLAVWGDWSAHLAYAGSFAFGDNHALESPIAAGSPLRYHVLADFLGSLFTVGGLGLPQALVWSAWLLAVALPALLFAFVRRLTGSTLSAALVVVLLGLSGGVGAWYFLQDVRLEGWEVVWRLPRTYARMPDQALWMDNTVSASLYAQRSTLLGLATGLGAGVLLLAARPRWVRSGFVVAGILVGTTGLSHVHTLGTALALGALAWLADRRSEWLWFLAPAAALGIPLAYTLLPPTSRMRWLPGWMADQSGQAWPWFWFRNVGLLLPLFLLISLFGGVPRRIVRLTAPLWLWFVAPNLISFHPWEGNNTKFFLFWQLAACIAIAELVRRAWTAGGGDTPAWRRIGGGAVAALAVVALTVTGGLDAVRAMQRSAAIPWADDGDLAAADWLRNAAGDGDTLVYGATNTSAVAALSGVAAVSGYPGWTDDLGIPDWYDRVLASRSILSGDADAAEQVERYGVDYVVIGPRERAEMGASDAYWAENGTLLFEQGDYRIYGA